MNPMKSLVTWQVNNLITKLSTRSSQIELKMRSKNNQLWLDFRLIFWKNNFLSGTKSALNATINWPSRRTSFKRNSRYPANWDQPFGICTRTSRFTFSDTMANQSDFKICTTDRSCCSVAVEDAMVHKNLANQ